MSKSIVYEVRCGGTVMDFVVSRSDVITEAIPPSIEKYFVGKRYRKVLKELRRSDPSVSSQFVAVFS